MAVDHNNPQSRTEEILIATIDGEEYNKIPQSRLEELLLELKQVIEAGGGGGGTTNYNNLSNKPQVNGITLSGDKSASDLSLVLAEVGKGLSTNDYSDEEKAKVANLLTAIEGILTGSDIDSFGDVETALSDIKDGVDIDSFGDVEVALLDKADISDLGTAAAKDSTNAVTSGSTDLVESGAVKDAIDAAVAAAYHHAGTKTVAQLTHDLLIAANEGNVYNITDSGTTTSDFIEGIGKTIDEGSNVGICKVGNVYMFDLLSGFVNTTNFVQKSQTAGLLNNDGTVNTTIENDVDSLKSGLTNLDNEVNGDAVVYPYADVITIPDAVPANLADCTVKIEPVQDLHGQSAPYVGGAGKNKLPMTVAGIKSANTSGTWSGNVYTLNNTTVEMLTDETNVNVHGFKVNTGSGGASANCVFSFDFDQNVIAGQNYILNGCPTGGSDSTYFQVAQPLNASSQPITSAIDTGSGVTVSIPSDSPKIRASIRIMSGCNIDNKVFYPMIRLSTETDATFAPYTNYCPITGHTNASVQRDGKNLGVTIPSKTHNDVVFTANTDGTLSVKGLASGYAYTDSVFTLKAGSYYISHGVTDLNANVNIILRNNTTDAYITNASDTGVLFTLAEDTEVKFRCAVAQGYNADVKIYPMIRLSTETDATFVPYAGKTYTIALGDTIYGGTVDFDSGVMTVTHKMVEFDGSEDETWILQPNRNRVWTRKIESVIKKPSAAGVVADIMSDKYPANSSTNTYNGKIGISVNTAGYVEVADGVGNMDLSAWTTALSNSPLQVCYELATPTTIQLTPQQIQLLKGTNTLTASTGDISVTVNGVSGAIGSVQEQVNELDGEIGDINSILSLKAATAGTNITIVKGGYLQIGKLVIVDAIVTADDDISVNQNILKNLPQIGDNNYPISCFDIGYPWPTVNVRVYYGGVVGTDQLTSGHSYHIYGSYMCN